MKAIIEKAENGYIVTHVASMPEEKDSIFVCEDKSDTITSNAFALAYALRVLKEYVEETRSRYDEASVTISVLPRDKFEGEIKDDYLEHLLENYSAFRDVLVTEYQRRKGKGIPTKIEDYKKECWKEIGTLLKD